ncbi:hypothetical protein AB832_05770, partial [Flavobacteriaceae bacterium (ex Bugula neritina AB1)]
MKNLNFKISVAILLFVFKISGKEIQHIPDGFPIIDSIQILLKKGDSLSRLREYSDSKSNYKRAYNLARRKTDKDGFLRAGFKLALEYGRLKEYEEGEKVLEFIQSYCEKINDTVCLTKSKRNYGHLYHGRANYLKALEAYNEALKLVKCINNNRLHYRILKSRGLLFLDLGSYEESKNDFKRSLSLVKDKNSKRGSNSYANLATVLGREGKTDQAIFYLKMAAEFCEKNKTLKSCISVYNNMAYMYLLKGMPEKALKIIYENIDLDTLDKYKGTRLDFALMHTLGAIHFEMQNYEIALEYYQISHKIASNRNEIQSMIIIKEDLSEVYEILEDYKKTIAYLKEIKILKTTLDDLKIRKEIAKTQIKKALEENKVKISSLTQENLKKVEEISKVKLFSYLLTFFLVIILFTLLFNEYKTRVRFHKINEELSLNRFKSLRSMMNPHFLFNSFSTLQNYILKKENTKAVEYMAELSGLIRNVLSTSDSIYTSFSKELKLLQSYINIEQCRFDENFDVEYNIDQDILDEDPTIPSMIVQPYIENAIIHGFSNSNKRGLLGVTFTKQEN